MTCKCQTKRENTRIAYPLPVINYLCLKKSLVDFEGVLPTSTFTYRLLNHEGLGVSFFLFFLHNRSMNILQTILMIFMRKFNTLSILVLLSWKTLRRWLIVGIHPMAAPCMDALIVVSLSSLLSAVTPDSVLPVEQSIPWTELLPCLLN